MERLLVKLTDGRILQFIPEAKCPSCEKELLYECNCSMFNPITLEELLTYGFMRDIPREEVTQEDIFVGQEILDKE